MTLRLHKPRSTVTIKWLSRVAITENVRFPQVQNIYQFQLLEKKSVLELARFSPDSPTKWEPVSKKTPRDQVVEKGVHANEDLQLPNWAGEKQAKKGN